MLTYAYQEKDMANVRSVHKSYLEVQLARND
jgi:hypothetical protein